MRRPPVSLPLVPSRVQILSVRKLCWLTHLQRPPPGTGIDKAWADVMPEYFVM
jgi:hypothetical protein